LLRVARAAGGNSAAFGFDLLPAFVPVAPVKGPRFAGELLAGRFEKFFGGRGLCLHGLFLAPLGVSLEEGKAVAGVFGTKLDGLLQMLARLAAASEAGRPARGVAVQDPNGSVSARIVKLRIELYGLFPDVFHLVDELQSTQEFGCGKLAEIQTEIIMGRRRLWIQADAVTARIDPFLGQCRTLRVVGCEFGQIERGAAEHPGSFHAVGLLAISLLGFVVDALGPRGDGRDAGDVVGRPNAGSPKPNAQNPNAEP